MDGFLKSTITILLSLFTLFGCSVIHAQNEVSFYLLKSQYRQSSPEQVRALPDTAFKRLKGETKLESANHYWGKLHFEESLEEEHVIELGVKWDFASLYFQNAQGVWVTRHTGALVGEPKKRLPFYSKKTAIRIEGVAGNVIFFRVENISHEPPRLDVRVEAYLPWLTHNITENKASYIFQYIFTGTALIMVLYGLSIFALYRDRVYLYYCIYIFSAWTFGGIDNGLIQEVFTSEFPAVNIYIRSGSIHLVGFFYLAFIQRLVKDHLNNTGNRIIIFYKWLVVAHAVFSVGAIAFLYNIQLYKVSMSLLILLETILIPSILVYSIRKQKHTIVYYALLSTCSLFVAALVSTSISLFTDYNANFGIWAQSGIIIEILFFSLGLNHKLRETERANRNILEQQNTLLEFKVKARTRELQQHQEEVTSINESLEKALRTAKTQQLQLEQSYQSLRTLSEIGKKITQHISVEGIIDATYEEVNKLMPAEGFGIGIFNAKENRIDFPGYIEKGEKLPFHWDVLGDDDSLSDYCFKYSKELFIREYDLEVGEYIAHPAIKEGEKPESLLFLPLLAQGKPIGNITVQSFAKNAYTDYHLSLLRNLAIYVAIALDNATAYQQVDAEREKVDVERKKSESLLLNILPAQIALELKEKGYAEPRVHEEVTVLFTDFRGFTQSTTSMRHDLLINALDECFQKFDKIMEKYGLEKIKTIGDSYMAVSGLPASDPEHAEKAVRASLEIRDFIKRWQRRHRRSGFDFDPWEIRIGLHSGQVVAGVVGKKKFAYDIWGDTVNVASRMESNGHPAKVNISAVTKQLLESRAPGQWAFEYRGEVQAKGKGMMRMYFVEGGKNAMLLSRKANLTV